MKRTLLFLMVLGAMYVPVDAQLSDTVNTDPSELQIREIGVNVDLALAVLARFPEIFQEHDEAMKYFYFDITYKWGKPYRVFWADVNYSIDFYGKEFGSFYPFDERLTYSQPPAHLEHYANDTIILTEFGSRYGDRFGASFGLEWRSANKLQITHGPSLNIGLITAERSLRIRREHISDPFYFPFGERNVVSDYMQSVLFNYQLAYTIGALFRLSERVHFQTDLRIGYSGYLGDDIVRESYHLKKQAVSESDPLPFLISTDVSLFYRF